MAGEQFSLCWDNFHKNMSSGMHSLLESEDLVDVTLAVEGKYLKAHKMVLSVCSPYFRELFQMNPCKHPIVFMKDVSYTAMSDLLTFMYQGEVQVNQEQLTTFIKTAEALQIKGLTSDGNNDVSDDQVEEVPITKPPPPLTHHEVEITKPAPRQRHTAVHPPPKRQRTASPVADRATLVPVKGDAVSVQPEQQPLCTEQLIQFKMEPYEVEQSDSAQAEVYEDNPDDNFAEDGADDSQMDDGDYSAVLKGEEEEPQAGTSGDGTGESQDGRRSAPARSQQLHTLRKNHKIVHNGFFYNISTTRKCNKRYYRCANKKNTGCLATAVMDKNAPLNTLAILRPHNHPPDKAMEMRYNFEMVLAKAVNSSNASIRAVYDTMAAIYPEAAEAVPYDQNLFSRLKRRRISPPVVVSTHDS